MGNTPVIRFKGFADDWEQRKLGDLTTHKNGVAIEKYFVEDGPYKVISIGSYGKNNEYVDQGLRTEKNDTTASRIAQHGDLTMVLNDKTTSGEIIGRVLRINADDEYVINQRTELLRVSDDFDSQFAYTILNGPFRNKVKRIVQGGTQIYVNYSAVASLSLSLPEKEEQQAIALMFERVQNLITLHQRKLDLLKEQKKGYLQKMFPKNGAKVPELRFAGFADDWEERKLSEEVSITMGQSPQSKNYTDNPDDHILVQGNADLKNGRVEPRVWTTQVTKSAPAKTLILGVRAPVGTVGITDYDVVLGRGVAGISGNSFIYQLLTKMKSQGYWDKFTAGSTFESINSDTVKNAAISVPELDEQNRIGQLLTNFDSIITLHQRKLDSLEKLKKLLLQKMFI